MEVTVAKAKARKTTKGKSEDQVRGKAKPATGRTVAKRATKSRAKAKSKSSVDVTSVATDVARSRRIQGLGK
jgi:hypothetical protein